MIESHLLRALFLCLALVVVGGCVEMPQRQPGAALWINHDKPQSDSVPKAPAYIE